MPRTPLSADFGSDWAYGVGSTDAYPSLSDSSDEDEVPFELAPSSDEDDDDDDDDYDTGATFDMSVVNRNCDICHHPKEPAYAVCDMCGKYVCDRHADTQFDIDESDGGYIVICVECQTQVLK